MRETISAPKAPQAAGPYSLAIRQNGFVYVSGQIPLDPKTMQLITGPFEDHVRRVLDNVTAILDGAGLTREDIIKTTVFLKDMGNFDRLNAVYNEYFPKDPPARSCIQVAKLPRDVDVEIEAIAVDTRATRL